MYIFKQTGTDRQLVHEWDKHMRRHLNATQIRDPHLLKAAEEYAKRLNIKTPLLYVAEEFPAICGGKMPNAMAFIPDSHAEQGAIAFTRKKFSMHGYALNSGVKAPNDVLSTLGHEMAHLKQGGKYFTAIRKYPGLIGMAGAIAGLYFLDKAIERTKKKQKDAALSDESIKAALGEVTSEEREKTKKLLQEAADSHELKGPLGVIARYFDAIGKAGEYMAGTMMGFMSGKFVTRHLVIGTEFEADKIGAELCGDPRARIRALKMSEQYIASLPKKELETLQSKITLKDIYQALFDQAHPSTEERIKRLEEMARRMEENAGKAVTEGKTMLGALLERICPALVKLEKVAVKSHIHIRL